MTPHFIGGTVGTTVASLRHSNLPISGREEEGEENQELWGGEEK